MPILTLLQFFLIVFVVIYLSVNLLHLIRVEPVQGELEEYPLISVCVPARNEERSVGTCVTSLLRQDYPNFEVIVVDDNSTDGTAEILNSLQKQFPQLTVIPGKPLPENWLGKPHALDQAYRIAKGELLLFTDADPEFESFALRTAVYYLKSRNCDVLTLMPGAQFGSFWERTVQPVIFGFIGALSRFKGINDPESNESMGIGAFLLFKRKVYEALGGHERVRQEVVEDLALSKAVKKDGFNLMIADGKEVVSIRMYYSLQEIWEGWRKNLFFALKKSVFKTFYYIGYMLGFMVTPYLVVIGNLIGEIHFIGLGLSCVSLGMVWVTCAGLCWHLRLPMINLFLFPLGTLVVSAIMINSMYQTLFKGITEWRGRSYSVAENK